MPETHFSRTLYHIVNKVTLQIILLIYNLRPTLILIPGDFDCYCSVALPLSDVGWSVVYESGIS